MGSPADGALTILRAEGVVQPSGVNTGWASRLGKMTDTPNTQVVCYDTGGLAPHPSLLLDYRSVQVQIRGNADDYRATWVKAQEVKDTLLGLTPQVVNGDRWDGVIGVGDLLFLHRDENDRPVFSVNFRVFLEPAPSAATNRTPL